MAKSFIDKCYRIIVFFASRLLAMNNERAGEAGRSVEPIG